MWCILSKFCELNTVKVWLFGTSCLMLFCSDGQIQVMIWFKSWLNHWWRFDLSTKDLIWKCDLIWIWFHFMWFDLVIWTNHNFNNLSQGIMITLLAFLLQWFVILDGDLIYDLPIYVILLNLLNDAVFDCFTVDLAVAISRVLRHIHALVMVVRYWHEVDWPTRTWSLYSFILQVWSCSYFPLSMSALKMQLGCCIEDTVHVIIIRKNLLDLVGHCSSSVSIFSSEIDETLASPLNVRESCDHSSCYLHCYVMQF